MINNYLIDSLVVPVPGLDYNIVHHGSVIYPNFIVVSHFYHLNQISLFSYNAPRNAQPDGDNRVGVWRIKYKNNDYRKSV